MGGSSSKCEYIISGTVAPGYESVKEIFEKNFQRGVEENAQLCVYVGEKRVVDLWGSTTTTIPTSSATSNNPAYTPDTLTNVFSSTKSLTALLMAMAHDRGLLGYTDRIAQHWPEFAQNGKESATVADLMRHEVGLNAFHRPLELAETTTENIKKNVVGGVIEASGQEFPPWGRRGYHFVSRGWVANEIFRRVSPGGATMKEFLRAEVADRLDARVFIGCTDPNYSPVRNMPNGLLWLEAIKCSLGRDSGIHVPAGQLLGQTVRVVRAMWGMKSPANIRMPDDVNSSLGRGVEGPSYNGNCSGRGLALVAAALANRGTFNGVQLLSEPAWAALHANVTADQLLWPSVSSNTVGFSQGGVAEFGPDAGGRSGYWGWQGYGGSVFQWHPELRIGFGFTCTLLHVHDLHNTRAAEMQGEVVKCARAAQQGGKV